MKYTYLIVSLICCSVLFLSNTTDKGWLFLVDGQGEPDLPESPYDYSFEFPEHLLHNGSPYGETDTTDIDPITNNGATLGRVLFYDELLSANENLSCATCHQQELSFADATAFSPGVSEDTKRNSMHLNDLAWTNKGSFFWDMSQGNLETMIALPLENVNEIGVTDLEALVAKMEATTYYPELFEKAFGEEEITLERIQKALGHFIRSMVTFDTKLDKAERGELQLTIREELGRELFFTSCEMCHVNGQSFFSDFGAEYPDNIFFAPFLFSNEMGIDPEDLGAGEWAIDLEGLFKSPTLRNIELTAPYMHDGRFETLREVIDHYSDDVENSEWGMIPDGGFKFSENEKEALEAFLKTMTDTEFTNDIRWSDPFGGEVTGVVEAQGPIVAVEVFPNPSNGMTTINFENITGRKIYADLINMQGQVVRRLTTHRNGFVTDVSLLPKGMYIVRIKNGDTFIDKQLMVQ